MIVIYNLYMATEQNTQTLLLNSDYRPIQIVSWQRAICLWFSYKVEVIEEYEDIDINSVNFKIKCPAVVKLSTYRKNFSHKKVKFTRLNVFQRDNFQCQYCRYEFPTRELTFDHVIPVFYGGKTTWTNIVTSCHTCNSRKGSKLPEEIGMRPYKRPIEPNPNDYNKFSKYKNIPIQWEYYIGQ
jgi:5-methylcytosine-specific restriction endonuclease McrA